MMMKSGESLKKRVLGGSVQGAAHIQQNKPCQDDMLLYDDPEGRFVIACVADGHGSVHCPLSDEGAKAATEIALELLKSIIDGDRESKSPTGRELFERFNSQKEIRIPKKLEELWKKHVKDIHAKAGREAEDGFPYLLYGTTLIAVTVTDEFIFAMQIGDGDILMLDPDGEAKHLFPAQAETSGAEVSGSETFSLCMEDSWKYVQTQIIPMPQSRPLMFLLCTDGYANSFSETAGFLKAGADIYSMRFENGEEYISGNLEDWLNRSSEIGSGDDITLAIVTVE